MQEPRGLTNSLHPMSEELNQAVPETSAPETVSPRAADFDDPQALKNKLDLVTADRQRERDEKRAYKKQVEDMERRLLEMQSGQRKQDQERMVKNQEFEALWKEASQSNSSLQDQLAERDQTIEKMKVQFQQEQIKASATNLFAQSGVNAPDHLMKILGENLRLDENGAVVCLSGGVQVPLNQHIQNLKTPGSGFEMFFSGSGAVGGGAIGSNSSATPGKDIKEMTLTEKVLMQKQNPQLWAQLQAQQG